MTELLLWIEFGTKKSRKRTIIVCPQKSRHGGPSPLEEREETPLAKFVFEDLSQIRENRITYQGEEKKARRQTKQWPVASLQGKITYPVQQCCGIAPVRVESHYTGKTCPTCRHVSPEGRPNNGNWLSARIMATANMPR